MHTFYLPNGGARLKAGIPVSRQSTLGERNVALRRMRIMKMERIVQVWLFCRPGKWLTDSGRGVETKSPQE